MTALSALRPPPEFEALRWHWINIDEGDVQGPVPVEWDGTDWLTPRDLVAVSPEEAVDNGWRYSKPCDYEDAPSDADVERVTKAVRETALLVPGTLFDLLCTTTYANEHSIQLLLQDVARAAIAAMKEGS